MHLQSTRFNISTMNKSLILMLFFIFLPINICLAQQNYLYRQSKLSSNLITKITQDSVGYIWIGTENGLNKFDGWNYTHYFRNDEDSMSLSGNYIETFLTDSDETLWIGCNRGLHIYSTYEDNFHKIKFPNNIHPSIKDIIQLRNKEIWVVTAGYGIFSIDKENLTATSIHRINNLLDQPYAIHIFQDRNLQIWIALSDNRIARISANGKEVEIYKIPIEPKRKIQGITEDHKGRMYIATSSEIFLWDNILEKLIRVKIEGQMNIRGITCSKEGILYVHTAGQGLKEIDSNTMCLSTIEPHPNLNNIKQEKINAFYEDNKGNLWLGCYKKGLLKIMKEPSLFDFWNLSDFLGKGSILSIYKDKKNTIWLGTYNSNLLKMNEKGEITSSFFTKHDVASIFEDSTGIFWLGSHQGNLLTFCRETKEIRIVSQLKNKSITEIIEDTQGNLYFSTLGEGFVKYNTLTKEWIQISDTTTLNNTIKLSNNWIGKMLCDSDGFIWLAHSTGLDCYDPQKHIFIDYKNRNKLDSYIVTTLIEDRKKRIWIGTNNGLYKYNKENNLLEHFGIKEGLPNNIICGIGTDYIGNIWCSTQSGLFKLNYDDNNIAYYYSGNGLVDKEYSVGLSLQDKEGNIYFGGLHGITKFMPDSIKMKKSNSYPILSHIYINNTSTSASYKIKDKPISDKKFNETTDINLSHKEKSFSLLFSTMDFHNPENIIFQYRLLEMNKEWSKTFPGENQITYNFLSPGNYTLEVRSFENNTYSPINRINIHIMPPWYYAKHVKFIYFVLFLGFIISLYITILKQQQRRQEAKNNEEKLRFFINLAHELRSPLTLIISPLSELLKENHQEKTIKQLRIMQLNAYRIMSLINQLLDIRKIDKGQIIVNFGEVDLVDFIRKTMNLFEYQAEKQKIRFSFESDFSQLPIWIDTNSFEKILTNLITNSLKYTPKNGEITIILTIFKSEHRTTSSFNYAEIRIIDSGIGLKEKEIKRIFDRFYQSSGHSPLGFGIGLNLTKMLVELHNGTIQAFNRTDKRGSCFIVRIPLDSKHLKTKNKFQQEYNPRPKTEPYWQIQENDDESTTKNKKRKRILVVDDDEDILIYLQRELSQYYKIITATNGSIALRILLQQKIDLIISDINMPEGDGFMLLKKIKENNNISHTPIILLTSHIEFQSRIKGWQYGADGFIEKPFYIEELRTLCDNLISNRSLLKGKFNGIKELETKITPIEIESNDDKFIDRLMIIINANISDPQFNVEILAKEIGISRSQLYRKIKDITGISTSEFIRNERLKLAAKLLKKNNIDISQIAYATGFNNPSQFSAAFKNFYGCTPSNFSEKEKTI